MSIDPTIAAVYARFFGGSPVSARIIDTSRGDGDFRTTALVDTANGSRYVLKLAANDFTSPDRIRMWQRTAEEYRAAFYGKMVPDTFNHRSSTLQDIEKGRKTEIDTLNGCVLRIGRKHGVPTLTHAMIVEMIRGIEDIRC